ncbi:MAG TPA: tripartite tricarboxylate transporter substrate-binding protein [Burkholderiaceae bacterium]|nr:tripartite tricarboxylate transporter substrate-binding protein [Burkholderiaceae bacterium]
MPIDRRRLLAGAAALAPLALARPVAAQPFPSRPIRILVPVPPGGSLDLLSRTLAKVLPARLDQPVVVENHAGAGGNIAFGLAAQAPADGHTLLHGWDPLVINPPLYGKVPYRLDQFAPITLAVTSGQVLVTHPGRVPATDFGGFAALAAARPGALTIGTPGSGSPGHLAMSLLETSTGLKFVHVPYKGGGPAIADLLAGHLDAAFVTLPAALAHVRADRLRAIGLSSPRRSTGAPQIPTFQEGGVRGYELDSWQGFFAPAGTPVDAIGRLNREIVAALTEPALREQLVGQGFEVVGSPPQRLAQELTAGADRWAELVKSSGARVD